MWSAVEARGMDNFNADIDLETSAIHRPPPMFALDQVQVIMTTLDRRIRDINVFLNLIEWNSFRSRESYRASASQTIGLLLCWIEEEQEDQRSYCWLIWVRARRLTVYEYVSIYMHTYMFYSSFSPSLEIEVQMRQKNDHVCRVFLDPLAQHLVLNTTNST